MLCNRYTHIKAGEQLSICASSWWITQSTSSAKQCVNLALAWVSWLCYWINSVTATVKTKARATQSRLQHLLHHRCYIDALSTLHICTGRSTWITFFRIRTSSTLPLRRMLFTKKLKSSRWLKLSRRSSKVNCSLPTVLYYTAYTHLIDITDRIFATKRIATCHTMQRELGSSCLLSLGATWRLILCTKQLLLKVCSGKPSTSIKTDA